MAAPINDLALEAVVRHEKTYRNVLNIT